MIKIENLALPPGSGLPELREQVQKILRVPQITDLTILRRSIDAREDLRIIYTVSVTVENEAAVCRRCHNRKVSRFVPEERYDLPEPVSLTHTLHTPALSYTPALSSSQSHIILSDCPAPVVIGAGPAGLFAALVLAHAGLRPVILERGQAVETRYLDIERFRTRGELNPESNIQFGEGGAGAFSDGKLNTGTKNIRHRFILETLVECGAPQDILIDAKPHIGTDYLRIVLVNLRKKLLNLGAEIYFGTRVVDFIIENRQITGIIAEHTNHTNHTPNTEHIISVNHAKQSYPERRLIPCRQVILAPGHSARDIFQILYDRGIPLETKPFAVGLRIEHRQSDINAVQYRQYAGHPGLPAASYKLSCHVSDPLSDSVASQKQKRGVFSFCVCPGGEVVAATSEERRVVTNGMSAFARDRENINGGLLERV